MIGKFADPREDLMPWVEVTDSAHRRRYGDRPAIETEEENVSLSPISRQF
jgi:hypothetical protein